MKKTTTQFVCTLLTFSLLFSLMLSGTLTAYAADDFSSYFTGVTITSDDGDIDSLPKDAVIDIKLFYEMPATGLPAGGYTFTVPAFVVPAGGMTLPVSDGPTPIFTLVMATDGACTITFTPEAETEGYLSAEVTGWIAFNKDLGLAPIPGPNTALTFFPGQAGETDLLLTYAIDQITAEGSISNYTAIPSYSDEFIEWSFKVNPTMLNNNLSLAGDNEITDLVLDIGLGSDLTLIESGPNAPKAVLAGGGSMSTASFEATASGFRCNIASHTYSTGDVITVTYYTAYTMMAFATEDTVKFSNTAGGTFHYPQYEADGSAVATVTAAAENFESEADADVAAGFLSKEALFNEASLEITWVLTVNANGLAFDNATFDVADDIPAGLKLISITAPYDTGSSYSGSDFSGGTLTIPVTADAPHTIEYVTIIDPAIWQFFSEESFINDVYYEADYGGVGYGFRRTKTAECEFAGSAGILLGGSGSYDRTNHTFKWQINVNNAATNLSASTLTLSIPTGQEFESLSAGGYSVTPASPSVATREITVAVPAVTAAANPIVLYTAVTDPDLWATNASDTTMSIGANLATTGGGGINLTISPTSDVVTEVIKKSVTDYDYNTKIITYRVDYNQNAMAMTHAVITDILPAGLEYVDNSASLPGGFSDAGNTLTFTLGTVASTDFVTYQARVTDDDLFTSAAKREIDNTASITFDELTGTLHTVESTATKTVGRGTLAKLGTQNAGYRILTWTVDINPDQILLATPVVVDTLPDGLLADVDSVRLYEATVDASTGALSRGAEVYDGTTNSDYTVNLTGQTLQFAFTNDITTAYQLVFDADNLNPLEATYNNSVSFKNVAGSSVSSGDIKQEKMASGGTSNPKRGSIALTALRNENGTPIAGIVYTIMGTNPNNIYTMTTDENGLVYFPSVKFDTYTLTSANAPAGTQLVGALPTIELSSSSKNQTATAKYEMVAVIANVTLTYNANGGSGAGYPTSIHSVGENVNLKANPFTYTNYTFAGWNTQSNGNGIAHAAGDGYLLNTDTVLYAIWRPVTDNGETSSDATSAAPPFAQSSQSSGGGAASATTSASATASTIDVSAVTGVPLTPGMGGLILTAFSVNNAPVPGVVFVVEVNGTFMTLTTDEKGIAVLRDIIPGSYNVTLHSVPVGYVLTSGPQAVAVVQADLYVIAETELPQARPNPSTGAVV